MKKAASEIVRQLQNNGFEAYFAGGCVRDLLLGAEPKDIDIATSATPEQVEKLFEHTIPIGKQFGVVIVRKDDKNFDVATFRSEQNYSDNRRPASIMFSDAKTDAIRRDFTVNGLFLDPIKNKVIDFVNGQEDIKKRVIRFIGDPAERINEDHLRLLRAIRFKTTLGFQYDKTTFDAVRVSSSLIQTVAVERVRDELNRIFSSENRAHALIELSEAGILQEIIPEIEKLKGVAQPPEYHQEGDVFVHTYLALKSLPKDAPLHVAWAVLLHDIGKPDSEIRQNGKIIFHDHAEVSGEIAEQILKRLKFSRIEIKTIKWLVESHMKIAQVDKMKPNKRADLLLDNRFDDLYDVAMADTIGRLPLRTGCIDHLKELHDKLKLEKERVIRQQEQAGIFSGDDLIKLGLTPGSKFKEILNNVREQILAGKIQSKEDAITFVKNTYEN